MATAERESLKAPEVVLREADFQVSEKCCSRPSCFDYAARKNEKLIFIKIQHDIGHLSFGDLLALKDISKTVSANSVIVSDKTREKPLEDDTVYTRYGVLTVTSKTFESIILRETHPLIQAGPGGYYVEVDGATIKRRRQALGFSTGEMAELVGISRRTLYGYERGMAKATVAAAHNLVWALGVPVAKPVNIFEKPRNQHKCFLASARRVIIGNKLFRRIFRKLGCKVTSVEKAPFDFVISLQKEKMMIIGGVAGDEEKALDRRVDEILSVSKVVQAHPVLITEGRKIPDKDIPYICRTELSKIKTAEDLIENVT